MRLAELRPKFFITHGEPRQGMGVDFDCPHCVSLPPDERQKICVPFTNPVDGGPPMSGLTWQRTGDTFDDLTLTPSIDFRHGDGAWHGFITNGEMVTV